ncbi:ABC transporter permease [Phycicoccus sp. M110.8]|uniref:ABC transporter permease n=1 Tax=Phycicoccus sp. M110.8 TaxID=3075433 RepID=UPI0028FD8941|nr:ABC transporter permease [Phycicoccus sp. M110.8]MDU0312709.1 ABC transporter permease [Phycicoccus sp. M110.8]
MSAASRAAAVWQRRQVLRTLVVRDLRVRYAQSWLGYVWTVLDPLAMSLIYFVVFVGIFKRGDVGHRPYFLFLVIGLLSWQLFSSSVTDTARSLIQDARLVRSTNLPREIWVVRVVLAKTVEYLYALPVLVLFTVVYAVRGEVHFNSRLLLFPVGILLQFVLLVGVGLLLAPVTALVNDMQRVVRILLRMAFYLTPVLYAPSRVPEPWRLLIDLNPMTGVLELLRAGFFHDELQWRSVWVSLVGGVVLLVVGSWAFTRLERSVLKEI